MYEDPDFPELAKEAKEESAKDHLSQAPVVPDNSCCWDVPGNYGSNVGLAEIDNQYEFYFTTKPCDSLEDVAEDLRLRVQDWHGLDFSGQAIKTRLFLAVDA